jgi:hypothetical protein
MAVMALGKLRGLCGLGAQGLLEFGVPTARQMPI